MQPSIQPDGQVCVDMGPPTLRGPDVPTTLPTNQVFVCCSSPAHRRRINMRFDVCSGNILWSGLFHAAQQTQQQASSLRLTGRHVKLCTAAGRYRRQSSTAHPRFRHWRRVAGHLYQHGQPSCCRLQLQWFRRAGSPPLYINI